MKKIILVLSAIINFISHSVFAVKEDKFYIKVTSGYSKLDKVHGLKSGNAGFIGLGAGYYINNNIRTDLVFEHFTNITHKGTKTRGKIQRNHKTKGKIESLVCNGYIDLFNSSVANIFVGAGVGASQVEAKKLIFNRRTGSVRSAKYKAKTNFTFALHTGLSLEIAPKMKGEIFYSYKDFGKIKRNVIGRVVNYKGHHAGLGLRFDV